jgi:hypothetical protein
MIGRNRQMSKEDEFLEASRGDWVYLSMIRRMPRQLTRKQIQPAFHYRQSA